MRVAGSGFDIGSLPERYAADRARIDLAKQRQASVWGGRKPDAWPIIATASLTESQQAIPDADFREAFYDDELMLCSQVRAACCVANARADGVPSIRANLGTGVCLATLGLAQDVFADKMPWLKDHLTLDGVADRRRPVSGLCRAAKGRWILRHGSEGGGDDRVEIVD